MSPLVNTMSTSSGTVDPNEKSVARLGLPAEWDKVVGALYSVRETEGVPKARMFFGAAGERKCMEAQFGANHDSFFVLDAKKKPVASFLRESDGVYFPIDIPESAKVVDQTSLPLPKPDLVAAGNTPGVAQTI